jgi:hypothetical protein
MTTRNQGQVAGSLGGKFATKSVRLTKSVLAGPQTGLSWPRSVGLGADKPLWRDGDHA